MAAMRFEQVQRFILAKKYFGVRGTLSLLHSNRLSTISGAQSGYVDSAPACSMIFVYRKEDVGKDQELKNEHQL